MSSDNPQDLDPRIADLVEQAMQEVREEFLRRLEETRSRVETAVREASAMDAQADDETAPQEPSDKLVDDSAPERGTRLNDVFSAVAAIDRARSQSGVLIALLEGASGFASRAAFLVADETGLGLWSSQGFEHDESRSVAIAFEEGSTWWQLGQGRGVLEIDSLACAELCDQLDGQSPDDGLLVPMVLRDRFAGGLYADRLADSPPIETSALQLLTYVASQALETLPLRDRNSTSTLRLAADAPVEEQALELLSTLLGTETARTREDEREDEADEASEDGEVEAADPEPQEVDARLAPDEVVDRESPDEEEANEEEPTTEEEVPDTRTEDFAEDSGDLMEEAPPADAGFQIDDVEPVQAESDDGPAQDAEHDEVDLLPWQTDSLPDEAQDPEAESPGPDKAGEDDFETDIEATAEPLDDAPTESKEIEPFAHEATEEGSEEMSSESESESTEAVGEDTTDEADTGAEPPSVEPEDGPAEEGGSEMIAEPQEKDVTDTQKVDAPPAFENTEVRPPEDVDGPGWAFDQSNQDASVGETDAQHEEARRLARLLVTEIKLYNEDAVEEGLQSGNIMQSLRDDIERSRLIYVERTSDEVRDGNDYFHDELVRILAGGDAEALGT